jgi:hypothetical protein
VNDFNSLFPSFLNDCVQLKTALMPIAYLLLTAGMISTTIADHRSVSAMMRTFGRTIVYIVLLTFLVTWGNQLSQLFSDFVKNQLGVDPANVFEQYKAILIPKKSPSGHSGMLEWIFNWRGNFFEMLIAGLLWIFGIFAGLFTFLANIVQHFILYLGYTLAPIFIGFMAFGTLRRIGVNYLLNLMGVIIWPLGWGVAAIVTSGLLNFMTDQSFLTGGFSSIPGVQQVSGGVAYGLQNLIGVTLLGIWLIFSTIAVPVLIHKALASGALIGADMLSGARNAAVNAASSGIAARSAMLSDGGSAVAATIVGGAAAFGTMASSSSGDFSRSIFSTLAQARQQERADEQHAKPARFPANDPTGKKSVDSLLRKTRNPYSG